MSDDLRTSFLTYYIRSLGERTREEKKGTKFGFDWIIYNLVIAEDWTPHRLPFLRAGGDATSTTKTEPEFGVDLAFVSPDQKTLRVFVLKDEVLNNANWGAENFDIDLRNASAPDLSRPELAGIQQVEVILAYNKDDDRTGIELFDRRVASFGSRVGNNASLQFDRWNLTSIVDRVKTVLLTPSLLPQKFFSHFSYICAQFADFRHGSDEWTNQLVPNWRRFLEGLLSENADERCVRLLPVALLILQEHGKNNPTAETAWIDLIEWGMLAAWRVVQLTASTGKLGGAVWQLWTSFYLAELNRYYESHAEDLRVRYSLDSRMAGGTVDTIASAVIAHWHVARLGILGAGYNEALAGDTDELTRQRHAVAITVSNWLVEMMMANPSTARPVIDLHHIELYLVWSTFTRAGRTDLVTWLQMLASRLLTRRSGLAGLPFIEGNNSVELVFECVASGEKPDEFCDTSSCYLTYLLEMICALPVEQRDGLLNEVYRRLVLGMSDDGSQMQGSSPIDLMTWIPPDGWGDSVLVRSLRHEGECCVVELGSFRSRGPLTGVQIAGRLGELISETREKRKFEWPQALPCAVVILACVKHRSPLPTELWRQTIFPPTPTPTAD